MPYYNPGLSLRARPGTGDFDPASYILHASTLVSFVRNAGKLDCKCNHATMPG